MTVRDWRPLTARSTIQVHGERHALAREMANRLLVEIEGRDA